MGVDLTSPSKRKKRGGRSVLAKPKNNAEIKVSKVIATERQRQLLSALEYLRREHEAGREVGALDRAIADPQRYPFIKCTTLYRAWTTKLSKRKGDLRAILTVDEEELLCEYLDLKNQAAQAFSREEIRLTIVKILQLRSALNARGGAHYPLSKAAQDVLAGKKPTWYFWNRFFAEHPDLKEGTTSQVSQKRTGACTLGTAQKHIDGLMKMLMDVGIMEPDGTISPENLRRVFNSDETPQLINYALSARTMRRVGKKGTRITKYSNESRESVTLSLMISLDGRCGMLQVLFSQKHLTVEQLSPDVYEQFRKAGTALVVQASEKGYQTSKSWIDFLGKFDKHLTEQNITRPVALLLDGHISRFSLEVLMFCREKQIRVYLSPPDTTGLTQALDQINHALHYHYCTTTLKWERYVQGKLLQARLRETRADLGDPELDLVDDDGSDCESDDDDAADPDDATDHAARSSGSCSLNKADFLKLLALAWPSFNKSASIVGAFRRVGITPEKTSVDLMQKDKFKAADMLLNRANTSAAAAGAAAAAAAVGPSAGAAATEPVRKLAPGQVFVPMVLRSSLSTPTAAGSSAGPPEYVPAETLARIGSVEHWRHKYEEEVKVSDSLRAQLRWFSPTPRLLTLDNEEVFAFDQVQDRDKGGKKRVSVGIFGCLEEAGALEAVAASKAEEEQKEAAKRQRLADREERAVAAAATKAAAAAKKSEKLEAYFACLSARHEQRSPCACGAADASSCKLKKHQLCPTCESVTIGGCTKKGGPCEAARSALAGAPASS